MISNNFKIEIFRLQMYYQRKVNVRYHQANQRHQFHVHQQQLNHYRIESLLISVILLRHV